MKKNVLFVLSVVLLSPLTAFGYDTSTHAALTREAYNKSTFQKVEPGKPDLLTLLGVSAYGGYLGNVYFDMAADGRVLARHNNPGRGGATGDADFTKRKFDDANARLSQPEIDALPMQSPTGWLMVGSIREDDYRYNDGNTENPPQDDMYGSNHNMNRVFHHFYDPYRDIPLRTGINLGAKTPEWAIEGTHRGPNVGSFSGHDNRFTIKHAREAMFRAATLRMLVNGNLEKVPTSFPSGRGTTDGQFYELIEVESEEKQRRAYWATVFKALGHSLHLLHDMGQPQHVRNDSHSGTLCPRITGVIDSDRCAGGEDSFYEKYIEARVAGKGFFTLTKRFFERYEEGDVEPSIASKPLNYDGYAKIPRFNGYYDYYRSQGTGAASYSGTGLANYTNMGFFSAGTNLGAYSPYSYPPRESNAYILDHILPWEVEGMNGLPIDGNEDAYLTLMRYPVLDRFDPEKTELNVPLTSYSVFDKFLIDKGKEPVYALNHYNYNAQADLLLPRAVSYSAGLIDYFFRGNMEISLPKEGVYGIVDHARFADPENPTHPINNFKGFGKIKLKLKNMTKAIDAPGGPYPQTMSDGILVATLKFYRNKDYKDDLSGELLEGESVADAIAKMTPEREMIVSEPIALNSLAYDEEAELTFNFPQELPINAWATIRLSVVFRGTLGDEEDAVIVTEKPIASPLFFSVGNALDYIHLSDGKCYTREQIIGNEGLWNMLTSSCKKSLNPSDPREFAESCKKDVMNAAIDFGGVDSGLSFHWISPEGALQVRRFGRVAFLMDNERTDLSVFTASYQSVGVSKNFSFENKVGVFFTFHDFRGIMSYTSRHLVLSGNNSFSGDACADGYMTSNDPTKLQGVEHLPVPATSIEGW